ncbi:YceI family protein [Cytophaga aurantiaca]|uniref:YceI family protein n=1 Tax=Cytophaga aurantiaca TaxID=29530 RepID=UPI0003792C91|nr:YceI family protein [Cytophaga aurantiaca]
MKQYSISILATALLLGMTMSFKNEGQPMYKTSTGQISFYSETPMENIEASSSTMISAINPSNKNIACVVLMTSFKFKNGLMQEHFNEKYVESDKYPKATYSGIINETIDYTKPGTYPVTSKGTLTIHGVAQPRTINGTLTIDATKKVNLTSTFDVKLVDHKIEVPQIVFNKIAEVIQVKLNANYTLQ